QVFPGAGGSADCDPRLPVVGFLGVGGWERTRFPRHRGTLSAEVFRTIRVSMSRHSPGMGTPKWRSTEDFHPERAIGFEPTTSSLGNWTSRPAEKRRTPMLRNSLRKTLSVCKHVRTLAKTCEKMQKFCILRPGMQKNAEPVASG